MGTLDFPTPDTTTRLLVRVPAGATAWFIANQLEELSFATSTIEVQGQAGGVTRDITQVREPYSSAKFNHDGWFTYIDLTPEQAQSMMTATDEGILSLSDSATNLMFADSGGFHVTDGVNTATVNPSFAANAKMRVLAYADKDANVLGIGYRNLPSGSFTWATEQAYNDTIPSGSWINQMYGNQHIWQVHGWKVFNKHKDQTYYEDNY
jgi:hypothetical protein